MFKFEIGQEVYYMMDNKCCSADILSRVYVQTRRDIKAVTDQQKAIYEPFGKQRVQYSTTHGIFDANKIFATKQELLNSL